MPPAKPTARVDATADDNCSGGSDWTGRPSSTILVRPMAIPPAPVSESLRQAIRADARPVLELAALADVHPEVVGRYLRGDGLPLEALDALCHVLGLETPPGRRPADSPPPRPRPHAAGDEPDAHAPRPGPRHCRARSPPR